MAPCSPPETGASSGRMPAATCVVGEALGDVRADAGSVDPEGALLRVGEDAVLAADYALNIGGVRHHGDDDVGVLDGVRDARGTLAAFGDELVDLVLAAVEAGDGVAGLDQVDGHGQAHDSESDDCNVAHVWFSF